MPPVPWGRIFTSRDVWLMVIAYFAFGYVAFIFLTWFFIYLKDGRGLDLKSSAGLCHAALHRHDQLLPGGRSDQRLAVPASRGPYVGRCVYGALTLFLAAVFLVIGSHAENTTMAVLALAGGAGALYLGQSTYWAAAADYAGPYTGVVSGMVNMGGQIAGALTASLTPYFAAKYGWSSAFYIAAGVAVVCAFAWFFVNPGSRLNPVAAAEMRVSAVQGFRGFRG